LQIQVLLLKQDDPKKCTAQKLVKFGLARRIQKTKKDSLVLDPFSPRMLLNLDKNLASSITAIDCSWNKTDQAFATKISGTHRKLPPLFAGNPVNYSKIGKLTTVEALSGSLFILGFNEQAKSLLNKFKWGHTFFELNHELLNDYSKLNSEEEIKEILKDYGILIKTSEITQL